MRKIITIILMLMCTITEASNSKTVASERAQLTKKWEWVAEAIAQVETHRDSTLVSKSGKYVGYLQISPILVKQVNLILGKEHYSLKDRYSREKSIEMFIIFQEHFNQEGNIEKAIRLWNSGDPHCMRNKTAKVTTYYNKVKKHLDYRT